MSVCATRLKHPAECLNPRPSSHRLRVRHEHGRHQLLGAIKAHRATQKPDNKSTTTTKLEKRLHQVTCEVRKREPVPSAPLLQLHEIRHINDFGPQVSEETRPEQRHHETLTGSAQKNLAIKSSTSVPQQTRQTRKLRGLSASVGPSTAHSTNFTKSKGSWSETQPHTDTDTEETSGDIAGRCISAASLRTVFANKIQSSRARRLCTLDGGVD